MNNDTVRNSGTPSERGRYLRRRLVLGTALATTAFFGGYRGYIRRAFADCAPAGGTYTCSGATTTTQTLGGTPLVVTTVPGFSIDTTGSGGNAFNLTGTDGLAFTDQHNSTITGSGSGIEANNSGTGALEITATGAVTGENIRGIYARNDGTDLTIKAAVVSGGNSGIFARNDGGGVLSITTTEKVSGGNFNGIFAKNNGTDLTIKAVDVSGGSYGINAQNAGSGVLSITATGNVTGGSTSDGIYAKNEGTDLAISVATVSSGGGGIVVHDNGSGALSITATGTVTGVNGDGILVSANKDVAGVMIDTAAVSGQLSGIWGLNLGGGPLSITATGMVTGGTLSGIFAASDGNGVTIRATDVSGGTYGINAQNNGSGALSIIATGKVSGTNYDGILAKNKGTDLTVNANDVSGGTYGINAQNDGSGALSITATGRVTGETGFIGILATNNYGTDLKIDAADVSGGSRGIFAQNHGSGALSITTTGEVSGVSNDGIFARNSGSDLTIHSATVSGGRYGINAHNDGSGALSITATGLVTGVSDGIYANSYGTDLTISVATVTSGAYGINVVSNDSGVLSITATGTVTGGADGIFATKYHGTDLTISAASIVGKNNGIFAQGYGSGALSITTTGTVTGVNSDGIYAINDGNGDLTISTAAVSGGGYGIYAQNNGSGALSITATGTVTGTTADGLFARNKGKDDLTIRATDVSGEYRGIYASNNSSDYSSSGSLLITATGKVSGASADGIQAINSNYYGNVKVSANDVSGGTYGIRVRNNYGRGSLSITATGTVSGASSDGIFARNVSGTDLTISAQDVSGGRNGIYAVGANVTINAAAVSGDTNGIFAKSDHGTLSITATGLVEGKSDAGIYAYSAFATSSDLTISAAAVSGGGDGIHAFNGAVFYGQLSITATGTVTGGTGDGISAANLADGMTISTADVSGGRNGISADNVVNGDLVINTANVSGGDNGILAYNAALGGGAGSLSITATGTVTGGRLDGIDATNYGSGSLTIDVVNVSGNIDGIHTLNKAGAVSITTTGTIQGATGVGILVDNEATDTNSAATVTVKSGSVVRGGTNGVETLSTTGRAATVVNAGSITGTTGVLANGGPMTVFNTGIITGGTAIDLTGAGHPSTVNQQGGTITGKILLSAASDTVNVTGGAIAGNIVGQGSANLNFALGSGTFTFAAPYAITGMAGVNMNSGTVTIAGTIDTDALTVNGGAMIVDGKVTILAGLATVNGGKLVVGDDTHATASLVGGVLVNNGGTLGGIGTVGTTTIMAGGTHAPGNDSLGTQTINGGYTNNGTLKIDMTPAMSGKVVVNGTVDISGAMLSLLLSPTLAADWSILNGPFTIIANDGGDAVAGTFSSVMKNLLFLDPSVDYAGGDGNDVTLELIRNDVKFADVAHTPNQKATGNGVDSLGWGNPVWNAIALQSDENATRAAFDRLSGEIYASTKSALIDDSHFVRDAVNDRIRSAFGDLSAPAMPVLAYGEGGPQFTPPDSTGPVAWGHAFGSWGSFDGDGNAAAMRTSTGGFLAGIDGSIASDIRLGFLTGYSHSTFGVDGRASSGSSDNYHLGLYAGGKWDALRLTGGLAYTWHDIKTGRTAAFPGFSESLTGGYSAGTFQAFGEAGYKIGIGAVSFEPFANLAYVSLRTDGFTEKGRAAALHIRGETTGTTFTTLGVHLSSAFDLGGVKATARGTIGWRHAFGDVTPISAHAFAGGSAFDIAGVPIAKDAALVEAGLDFNLTKAATLGIAYQGQFGGGATQNGFNARFQVKF